MATEKSSFPYSKALFELAQDTKNLDAIKNDVSYIKEVLQVSVEFKDIIKNPIFKKEQKLKIVEAVFGAQIAASTIQFLKILVQKNRIAQLDSICDGFMKLYSEGTNIVSLKLTTASAITDEMKNQLASSIVKNAKVEIKTVVDPSIIGGFIAEFNNQMLDESISTKINKLKQKINS